MASLIFAVLSLSVVWACPGATRPRPRGPEVQFQLKVGALRQIQLPPGKPLTREEVAEIKRRIRNLARISNPDVGLSPSFSGSAFAPIAEAREVGAMLLTSHKVDLDQAGRAQHNQREANIPGLY